MPTPGAVRQGHIYRRVTNFGFDMDSNLNRVLVLAVGLGTQVDPGDEHGDRPGGNVAVVWWQYGRVGANGGG